MMAAHTLAREYCRRSDFFYYIWFLSDNDDYEFSAGDLTSYEDTLEWVTFLTEQDNDSYIFRRGLEIRALLPVNPTPDIPE